MMRMGNQSSVEEKEWQSGPNHPLTGMAGCVQVKW